MHVVLHSSPFLHGTAQCAAGTNANFASGAVQGVGAVLSSAAAKYISAYIASDALIGRVGKVWATSVGEAACDGVKRPGAIAASDICRKES